MLLGARRPEVRHRVPQWQRVRGQELNAQPLENSGVVEGNQCGFGVRPGFWRHVIPGNARAAQQQLDAEVRLAAEKMNATLSPTARGTAPAARRGAPAAHVALAGDGAVATGALASATVGGAANAGAQRARA
ncbi:hypothetical protein FGB62_69g03 [Gracilaria domingensis]|nr:hypothetical protein FGB62_69g03 [Gracilaria domingensis]